MTAPPALSQPAPAEDTPVMPRLRAEIGRVRNDKEEAELRGKLWLSRRLNARLMWLVVTEAVAILLLVLMYWHRFW
jgi:hypothetical protein